MHRRGEETEGALRPTGMYIRSAQARPKTKPKGTAMYKMTGCACNAGSRAGQGMSYQFSKRFSAGLTDGSRPDARQHVTTYAAGKPNEEPRRSGCTVHTVMRRACQPPHRQAQQHTATLPMHNRPTTITTLHYTAIGRTKTRLTSAGTKKPATQTTSGSRATEPTLTKPTIERPRPPRTNHTQLQPQPDHIQTTGVPANTKPARRAWVETRTASYRWATPWCATPIDHHAQRHDRTPQLHKYTTGRPKKTHYTTLQ